MEEVLLYTVDTSTEYPSYVELIGVETMEKELHRALEHIVASLDIPAITQESSYGVISHLTMLLIQTVSHLSSRASIMEQLCGYTRTTPDTCTESKTTSSTVSSSYMTHIQQLVSCIAMVNERLITI